MSAWDDATREGVDSAEVIAAVSPFPHQPVKPNGGEPEQIETDRLMILHQWMATHHAGLQQMTGEKAHEYGSLDLSIMGDGLARLMPGVVLSEPQRLQLAVAFYLSGKYARIMAALAEGRDPGADSWHDAEVYAMMGARIRESGGWPG